MAPLNIWPARNDSGIMAASDSAARSPRRIVHAGPPLTSFLRQHIGSSR
jgi:hypothetical protein